MFHFNVGHLPSFINVWLDKLFYNYRFCIFLEDVESSFLFLGSLLDKFFSPFLNLSVFQNMCNSGPKTFLRIVIFSSPFPSGFSVPLWWSVNNLTNKSFSFSIHNHSYFSLTLRMCNNFSYILTRRWYFLPLRRFFSRWRPRLLQGMEHFDKHFPLFIQNQTPYLTYLPTHKHIHLQNLTLLDPV